MSDHILRGRAAVAVITLALLSIGCVPTSRAPVSEYPPSNGPHRAPEQSPVTQPDTRAPVTQQPPTPQRSSVAIRPGTRDSDRTARAVAGLLDDGWRLYRQESYSASVSVAERAMRIDRYDPQVYLLLARNYLAQFQLNLAEQLARQGLSVSNGSAEAKTQLQQVLSEIEEQNR